MTFDFAFAFAFYSTDLFHSLFHRLNDICLSPFDFDSAAFSLTISPHEHLFYHQ